MKHVGIVPVAVAVTTTSAPAPVVTMSAPAPVITTPAPAVPVVAAPVTTTTVPVPADPPVVITQQVCLLSVSTPIPDGGHALAQFAEDCATASAYVAVAGATATVTPYTNTVTTDAGSLGGSGIAVTPAPVANTATPVAPECFIAWEDASGSVHQYGGPCQQAQIIATEHSSLVTTVPTPGVVTTAVAS